MTIFENMDEIKNIPTHVSIIMDGNGRWAKLKGQQRVAGHFEGVESVRACVEAAAEAGVKYLSLFAFSEENWGRPESEVTSLMALMMKSIAEEIGALATKGVKFRVIGNLSRLGQPLQEAIREAERKTEPAPGTEPSLTLVVFMSYSGKWDILQAAKRLAKDYADNPSGLESVGLEEFSSYLATAGIPDPDLVIRTSGEQRISNYLLWQAAYSELLFVDTLWPDFRREEFLAALEEYSHRNRRYGKVK